MPRDAPKMFHDPLRCVFVKKCTHAAAQKFGAILSTVTIVNIVERVFNLREDGRTKI